jgi:hypothetical protein
MTQPGSGRARQAVWRRVDTVTCGCQRFPAMSGARQIDSPSAKKEIA